MTDAMTVNYLFFLGILIPCIITIVLFIVFIYCMRKFRIRREIMTKKHDPHGRLRKLHGAYAPPPPPLPPMWSRQSAQFKQKDRLLCERDNEAYDEAGEISQAQGGNHQLYQTCNDSGMSDLSEAQYRYDQERPYSQSSTDSEDSGFRSSRSGQYLHSAQNSNTQDMPLFKPIKSHRESLTMTVHQGCSSKQPSPSHRANSNCDFCRSSSRQSKQKQSCPSSRRKVCDTRPPSTLHQTPSPTCTKLDPVTMTFISNSSPSTLDLLPPPHTYRKNSPEAIDLQQIETDVKLSHIPSISQQCRPMTMTTAIVHAPLHHYTDNTPRMSYSVV